MVLSTFHYRTEIVTIGESLRKYFYQGYTVKRDIILLIQNKT